VLKLAVPPVTSLAFASLPRWARRLYGIPATPVADVAATAALHALRQGTSGVPGRLLLHPAARAASAARARRRQAAHAAG
jgi:hypothetical protein